MDFLNLLVVDILLTGYRAFSRRLPLVLMSFTRNATEKLNDFHREVESRARKVGAGIAGLHMLQQQLSVYENLFKDLSSVVNNNVNNHQKDINREFTPVIERAMGAGYTACVDECGK